MLVADGMGFVSHLLLVVAFYKHPRIRVGGALGDGFLLGFLFPLFQLLFGCIVPFLLGFRGRIVVFILIRFFFLRGKGFLAMGDPVSIHFLHQLFGIPLCFHLNFFLDHFLVVGVGFDVGAVYKDGIGVQIPGFSNLAENPVEYLVYSLKGETMLEIITDCGEMWCLFLQPVAQKPTICHIQRNFFRCPAQRG